MKPLLFFTCFWLHSIIAYAGNKDYIQYHKAINAAENEIFLKGNTTAGLDLFKKVFTDYGFVYVDDCIEAFELALYYKREDLATYFIKRAIDNGFEPQLLDLLHSGCIPQLSKKVTIWQPYMASHSKMLQLYAESVYPRYLRRLDRHLIMTLWQRHAKEQLFKNFHAGLVWTEDGRNAMKEQQRAYAAVCDDNLRFMDSLAKHGIYIGERNVGLYTLHLAQQLQLPAIDSINTMNLGHYRLALNTYVPVDDESEYFELNPTFNMLFHNVKSFDIMSPYSDAAIRQGYMHPREFATLLYNGRKSPETLVAMHLMAHEMPDNINRNAENALREKYYLPSVECDSAKHAFAHEHGLQLNFGFRNGTL